MHVFLADKFLPRSHKDHRLSAHGRRHVHRREEGVPYISPVTDREVWLLSRPVLTSQIRACHGRKALVDQVGERCCQGRHRLIQDFSGQGRRLVSLPTIVYAASQLHFWHPQARCPTLFSLSYLCFSTFNDAYWNTFAVITLVLPSLKIELLK